MASPQLFLQQNTKSPLAYSLPPALNFTASAANGT